MTLNPDNVNFTTFGKLFAIGRVGKVYAQPLYVGEWQFRARNP